MNAAATNPTLEHVPLRHRGQSYTVVRDAQGVLRVTQGRRILDLQGARVKALRTAYPAAFEPVRAPLAEVPVTTLADALTAAAQTGLVVRFGTEELSETGGHFVTLADTDPATVEAAFVALVNLVRSMD